MVKQIFVNLVANDLEATKTFWKKLGFSFNAQFTDQKAAALVLGENIFAMLIAPTFFTTFTKKAIIDASTSIEVISSLGVESKEEVDRIMEKALAAGGTMTRPADDYGWMYSRSFEDLDGHQWEVTYINEAAVPAHPDESVAKTN